MRKRSYFTLLEVIIAFFLVTLCAVPLIAPSVWIIQGEKDFALEIEGGRISNLLVAKFVEHLYANDFTWEELSDKIYRPFPDSFWEGIHRSPGWHYRGAYAFESKKDKKGLYDGNTFHLFVLHLSLIPREPREKTLKFDYEIFIERKTKKRSITPTEIAPTGEEKLEDQEEEDEE